MDQIKIETSPFVNHIRIETFRAQKTDLGNKLPALGNQNLKLLLQIADLMLNPGATDKTELTVEGVKAEIGQGRQSRDRYDQRANKGLLALTCGS